MLTKPYQAKLYTDTNQILLNRILDLQRDRHQTPSKWPQPAREYTLIETENNMPRPQLIGNRQQHANKKSDHG